MRRALLVQLPVPSFRWPRLEPAVPLAGAYLAAWARRARPEWQVDLLGWQEAETLGDPALLRAILGHQPERVGLSLYAWNAERSLALARRLETEGIPVVVGGPEVTPDNRWLWETGGFRTGVVGEGEVAYSDLLGTEPAAAPLHLEGAAPALATVPSPYLDGVLDPSPDGAVWLETVRGCPFRCAYCNYGKGEARPRPFPPEWLGRHLAWAVARGAREVYLMDPSFNVRAGWEQTLRALEAGNAGGALRFHTELVADRLRSGDAARLARAGLRSCEVGLQSADPRVLAEVGRPWDRKRWVRGVRELVGAGIEVVVGLIVGLPGDSLDRFTRTLEFVLAAVPGVDPQLFPLSLLPGTALRERAAEGGIEAQARPPYGVLGTPGFPAEDLAEAFDRFERATGLEIDPVGPPRLSGSWDGPADPPYLSGVRLDAARAPAGWIGAVASSAARNLILWVRGWDEGIPSDVARLCRELPHGVLTVVLEDGAGWPPDRLGRLLAAGTGEHYLDRHLAHLYGPGARLVPRLAVLVEPGAAGATPAWMARVRSAADVLWRVEVGPGWEERLRALAEEGEFAYVSGAVVVDALPALAARLGPEAAGVVFSCEGAQQEWERATGEAGFRAAEHRRSLP